MDWTEKYRPRRLEDIVGNTSVVRQMYEWAQNWTSKSRPLLLYGKPGIGKTSSAYALANDMNWEVIELNASDQRTKPMIDKIAGSSSTTASLTGASRKLILIDEADNLHAQADRGGAKAVVDIIASSKQPIILIANDYYGLSKELKAATEPVQFRALQARSIVPRLRYICSAEGIACNETVLVEIAEAAGGDMRAAVTMLYAAAIGKEQLVSGDIHTSKKDERSSIFELVGAVFKGREDADLMRTAYEVEDTPDTIEQWIEGNMDNLPAATRARGYRCISRADEYIGYTYRRQYYTLWRYATAMMLIGVADAAGGVGVQGRIMAPSRWQKMSQAKRQKMVRAGAMRKLSRAMHIPRTTLQKEYFTPISRLAEQSPEQFVTALELDADELNVFLQDKAKSTRIIKDMAKRAKEAEKKTEPKKKKKAEEPAREEKRIETRGQSTLF